MVNKSCKEDKNLQNSEEAIFLQDHNSPKHKWGYVNSSGNLVIADKFDDCRDFSDNRAAVNYKGKWGFIDTKGSFVVEPIYREAYGYKNGYAIVRNFDDSWHLLDVKANAALRLDADRVFLPQDRIVRYQKNGAYHYVGINGDTISKSSFLRASDFDNAIAIVKETDAYKFMNTEGKMVSKNYDRIFPVSEDWYRVKSKGKYSFISKSDLSINNKTYDLAFDFVDGEALVKTKNKYQVIDKKGKFLSTLDYPLIEPAGQGLYKVFKDEKWGLVNTQGKIIAELNYDMFYSSAESRIAFSKNGLWGFMDLEGNVIRSAVHPLVWDFKDGQARVIEYRRGIGFIDMNGDMRIPHHFIEVRDFYENLARVQVY